MYTPSAKSPPLLAPVAPALWTGALMLGMVLTTAPFASQHNRYSMNMPPYSQMHLRFLKHAFMFFTHCEHKLPDSVQQHASICHIVV
eukprot:5093748-Amphidinium_carterae.1